MTMVRDWLLEGRETGYPVVTTDGEGRQYLGTIDVSEAKNPTYRPPK